MQLYRDTTGIGGEVQAESSDANENIPFCIQFIDAPAAGTYSYSLKLNGIAGGDFQFGESTTPVLTVREL